MKKLEIVIRPEKLDELKEILDTCKVTGVMISNVMGYGNQKGYRQTYRGSQYNVNLLPKIKVETVVAEDVAEKLIGMVVKEINTGNYGDGNSCNLRKACFHDKVFHRNLSYINLSCIKRRA